MKLEWFRVLLMTHSASFCASLDLDPKFCNGTSFVFTCSTPKRVGDFSPGLSRIGDTLGEKLL